MLKESTYMSMLDSWVVKVTKGDTTIAQCLYDSKKTAWESYNQFKQKGYTVEFSFKKV